MTVSITAGLDEAGGESATVDGVGGGYATWLWGVSGRGSLLLLDIGVLVDNEGSSPSNVLGFR